MWSGQRRTSSAALTSTASKRGYRHALRNVVRYREIEADGEMRMLIIGPDRSGRYLELVAVPAGSPQRVIHADRLRAKFYDLL